MSRHATSAEIKKAYFELAKKYHPDVNKSPQAQERFGHISTAYATLGDEQKRRVYDQTGLDADEQGDQPERSHGAGFAGYEGFSDQFRQRRNMDEDFFHH